MNYLGFLTSITLASFAAQTECQFAYPVDPNPPDNPLTFKCFKCHSNNSSGCGNEQTTSDFNEACTGNRIGCWVTLDVESGVYERTCIQPPSVRQGVFCNRHMENKEFCYYIESTTGEPVKKCAKCCLNDLCNNDLLNGNPDSTFQTCIRCNGRSDTKCNEGGENIFKQRLTEQCLMPNSDCWTAITKYDDEEFYTRGCQISQCNDENINEICTVSERGTTCTKCCPGAGKCNYELLRGSSSRSKPTSLFMHAVLYCFVTSLFGKFLVK